MEPLTFKNGKDSARTLVEQALAHYRSGEDAHAGRLCCKVLEKDPGHEEALFLSGLLAFREGDHDRAEDFIGRAILKNPRNDNYFYNLGIVHLDKGLSEKAFSDFRTALQLNENNPQVWYHCGFLLQEAGHNQEALSCYDRALELKPDYPEAWNNAGNTCFALKRYDRSDACFKKAIALDENYLEAYHNRAVLVTETGDLEEAKKLYLKALQIDPDHAWSNNNLGNLCVRLGEYDQAAACYKKTIRTSPDHHAALMQLVQVYQTVCDWDNLERFAARLEQISRKKLSGNLKSPETPFYALSRYTDGRHLFAIAKSWSDEIEGRVSALASHFPSKGRRGARGKGKIRIGYLSNNFRNHPNAHLISGMIEIHDRKKFQVCGYSYGPDDGSVYRKRLERGFDRFVDLYGRGWFEMAKKIFEDRVDLLVDLVGYTGNGLMEVCALRPAPVQVRYLGFPGSTASRFFDYLITDQTMTPLSQEGVYSEKFIYVPGCYQVNDHRQQVGGCGVTRKMCGLPEEGFVFCSFNSAYKFERVMFRCWMRILKQVPGSVLWLLKASEQMAENLSKEAMACGVDSRRLVFAEKIPKDRHLARLKLADLALDTRLVSGHITTSDALRAGIPLVTLRGSHFVSRAPSSILAAAGVPELVTESLETYEALAVRLALDRTGLLEIREKLEKNRLGCSLFDTRATTRKIEDGLTQAFELFEKGERPRHIFAKEA